MAHKQSLKSARMTPLAPATAPTPTPARLPRVLCLHGAGSSGAIFRVQMRRIITSLRNIFEFVFVDAPFRSEPGPEAEVGEERRRVRDLLEQTLRQANEQGTPIVGIVAFSQGARVATGMLLEQIQSEARTDGEETSNSFASMMQNVKFALLLSGTYPELKLSDLSLLDAVTRKATPLDSMRISIPSVHVHGQKDAYRKESRQLLTEFYDDSVSTCLDFNVGHQVPTKLDEAERISQAIRHTISEPILV